MTKSENSKNSLGTVLHIAGGIRSDVWVYLVILLILCAIRTNVNAANKYVFPFTNEIENTETFTGNYEYSLFLLEEECGDGIDNDNDGKTDCEDEDCGPQITNVQFTVPTACGATDGSINISVSGGVPPYQFSVDNGLSWQLNGGSYTNLANNTYNIRVSNADETCIKAYQPIDVHNPESPILDSVVVRDPTLCFLNDGTLDIYARGTGLEFSIDGGNTFTGQSSYTGLAAGVYRVRVRQGECIVSHPNSFLVEPECASDIVIPSGMPEERCLFRLSETITLDLDGTIGSEIDDYYILTTLEGVILDVTTSPTLAGQSSAGLYLAFILGVENGTTVNGLNVNSYIQQVDIESLCYQWSDGYILEVCPSVESDCFDGFDNDGDGMTDCEDDDCSPIFMNVNATDPTDCDVNDGTITVSASGGQTSNYVYSIDNGQTWQTSQTFTGLAGGLYMILAANSDESCPRPSPDVILETPVAPTVLNVLSGNSTSCEMANGSITILASGSVGLRYSINGGSSFQVSNQFSGLTGGTYLIRVQNDDGTCMISDDDVDLTDPVLPTIDQVSANSPSGCGLQDGSITIDATGTSIEYSINGGNTYSPNNSFIGLVEGTYNIAVRNDDGSCRVLSAQNPYLLSSGAVVEITDITVIHPSNCNSTPGQIEIAANGSSILQYSIDNGSNFQASNVFSNLTGGDYEIVVSNSDGTCPETYPPIILVEESAGIIQNVEVTNPTDCGLSDGTITVTATDGSANLEYKLNDDSWQSANVFSNMPAGTYQVSIRNVGGNCEVTGSNATITDPVAPEIVNFDFSNDTRCDTDNGTITIFATGTGNLDYSIDGGLTWSSDNVFSDLGAGNYPTAIRNSDGSCQVNNITIPIAENLNLVSVSLDKNDPLCNGDQNGTLTPNMVGGAIPYSYAWSNGSTTSTLTGMGSGTYSVAVTDANGCSNEATMNLVEPPVLTSSAVSQDDESCNNCLIISASGGSAPYEYSADGINYQADNTISGIPGGIYTVTVKDANECTSTTEVELIDLNPLTCFITITSEITCKGGADAAIEVTIEDGEAPFEFSLDQITWSSDNTFSGFTAGEYTVFIRDNADNNSDCSITIEDSDVEVLVNISSISHESCFNHGDGVINVQATGGLGLLEYSIDGVNFQNNPIIESVVAGSYQITVRDENGCSGTGEATINAAPDLYCFITVNESVTCFGAEDGRLVAEATGGIGDIEFSLNGVTNSNGEFNNLSSGSYLIQITDESGCFSTCAAIVSSGSQLTCNIIQKSDVSCAGAADGFVQVGLEGGQGEITYQLGNTSNSTGIFENLSGGAYTITASDETGCVSNCSVTIDEADALNCAIITSQNISCFGESDGSFSVIITGGTGEYTYTLNGNPINSSDVNGLTSGIYVFEAQDENACSSNCEITISEPDQLICTTTLLSNALCEGGNEGSVRMNATGGVGAKVFTLGTESNSTGLFDNLEAGLYSGSVKDDNGCINFCSFEITDPEDLRCSIVEFENISCEGAADGSFTVAITGGTAPLSYSIDGINFGVSNQFNNLAPGFYIVNVRDANGCQASCSISLDEPSELQCVVDEFIDVNCSDEANGRIVVSGNGGSPPYEYSLNNAAYVNSGVFDGLGAGSYNVRVRDANGCVSICDLQVSEPTDLICDISNVTNTLCSENNIGSITVAGTGGQPPYQYSIDGINYQGNNVFDELAQGIYTISIRDAANCVVTCDEVTIDAVSGLVCEISEEQNARCGAGNGGSIAVTVSGGTAPFGYSIDGNNFQIENTFEDVDAATYLIYVKDVNDCISTCEAIVGRDENILPTVFCEESVINLNCDPPVIPDGNALILLDLILADDEDGTATVQVIDESISNEGCQYTSIIRFRAIDNCGQVTPL